MNTAIRSMRRACLIVALLACSAAMALPVEQQREHFQQLLESAQAGDLSDHPSALARIEDYPLYPYLVAADLTWRLRHAADAALDERLRAFLNEYPEVAVARTLRQRWVRNLAERGAWKKLVEWVRADDGPALQCHLAHARLRLDADDQAVQQAMDLWRVGRSQPEECDPVFEWLEAHGHMDTESIQGRARLAVLDGHYGLARYLAKKLSGSPADTVNRWLALVQSPGDLHHVEQLDPEIAVYAFKRLAHQDLDSAAELLPKLGKALQLDDEQTYEMRRYVALLFAQNHRPEATAWFERLDRQRMDDFVRAWGIRAAIYNARWGIALYWIDNLPPEQASDEEWRYWRARALEQLGRDQEAEQAYAQLAQERSYHGYLAADRLDRAYSLNERALEADPATRAQLLSRPAVQRTRELYALDMHDLARAEWAVVIDGLSSQQLQQAALLAHDWGWHSRAIITLARGDYWDDLDIRYPLTYRELAEKYARENDLDPALVLAVMRTESLFVADARSPAGAYGLMQLMPGTARQVAAQIRVPRPNTAQLKRPAVNVQLGSRYLRDMLDRFGGNLSLAMAAYNAGPRRIERWLPEQAMAADIWVANIPYTETREYVQRAHSHMTVFQARLEGDIVPLRRRMAIVEPPPAQSRS